MPQPNRVRVFIGCSLDGFIAGPNDELDWLDLPKGAEDTFTPFMAGIGAMLMGRRTFDVVRGFVGEWPYGEVPVLVATRRALEGARATVRAVGGSVEEMVAEAKRSAGSKDVYLDGGTLIRQALDAGLVDEITVSILPIVLGRGIPLFAGAERRHQLVLRSCREIGGGMVQLVYETAEGGGAGAVDEGSGGR
jgi:dihydrofolate reductase